MGVIAVDEPHQTQLQSLLALADRLGYVTWRQVAELQVDPESGIAILCALDERGIEVIDDPEDLAEQERAFEAHSAEKMRKPCWQLGDGWCFEAEVLPYPCQSASPSTIRLRCGHSLNCLPVPENVAYQLVYATPGFDGEEPTDEFPREPWQSLAGLMVSPTEFRLSLPAGVVFLQFRVAQPDYRPEPWVVSWQLEVE